MLMPVMTKDNLINPSDYIGKKYQSGYKPVDCDGETITPEKLEVAKKLHEMGLSPDGERDYTDMVTAAIKHDDDSNARIAELEKEKEDLWRQLIKADAESMVKVAAWNYNSGGFIQYAESLFQKIWLGDNHILRALMYMAASFKLQNPDEGIHLHVTGSTQSGKSDSVKTGLKLVSMNDQMTKTFSGMYLFYAAEKNLLHENTIIFSDDTQFSEEVMGLLRNLLTSWDTGVTRGTVKNQGAIDLNVPRHISLILTSIETVSKLDIEGQDASRFLTMDIRRTQQQQDAIWDFIQSEKENITSELYVLHRIWDAIPERKVSIPMKIAPRVTIRESKRFLTLAKCHALLCNRDTVTDEDISEVEKFLTYSKPMLDATTPALTRSEQAVYDALVKLGRATIEQLQIGAKVSDPTVRRALHGRDGTIDKPKGGLLTAMKNIVVDYDRDYRTYTFSIIKST